MRICIQVPLLISKKFIVLLRTLSAYKTLLIRYKVYSFDPRECLPQTLCTSWWYAEAYENFIIDLAPCRKNPMKNKIAILNCQPLLLAENYTKIKSWQLKFASPDPYFDEKLRWNKSLTAKVSLENLVGNVLKENKLWNRTFKSAVW